MKQSALLRGTRPALLAATAGICLAVTACGGGSAASGAKPAAAAASHTARPASGKVKLTGSFCPDVSATLRGLPDPTASTKKVTLIGAQQELTGVAHAGATGFAALLPEAPSALTAALKQIIAIYQADEKVIAAAGSTAAISRSLAKTNAAGEVAFAQVLRYISLHCK